MNAQTAIPGASKRRARAALAGAAIACFSVAWLPPQAAASVEVGGVRFAPVHRVGDRELQLHGAGVLRWRSVLRAYAAALYLPARTPGRDALTDVPKRLEIEYFWAIDAEDFGRAADVLLAEQLSPERLAELRVRLDEMHARFESVAPGDRYSLTYRPGLGTELAKNGRTLAVIPGSDFAEAYFGIWLGDEPVDSGLRDALRGAITQRARTE